MTDNFPKEPFAPQPEPVKEPFALSLSKGRAVHFLTKQMHHEVYGYMLRQAQHERVSSMIRQSREEAHHDPR